MGSLIANISMSLDGFVEDADAVAVDLVPVLLGAGKPFFADLGETPVRFDDPTVVEGRGVTHLLYRISRS